MARPTRSQRRARREAQQASGNASSGSVGQRARSRTAQVRPAAQPTKTQTGRQRAPRGRFVRESWAELKKVEWPTQKQVMTGVVVVLIACIIVGVYLAVADAVFRRLVENVFLGK
jgi:preprotein translocase subunit SecE